MADSRSSRSNSPLMSKTDTGLPQFENPPVIETVLGIFFRPLRKLDTIEQGIFWHEFLSADFPNYELRVPVEEISERFEGREAFLPAVHWQVTNEPETPRLWAKSPSGEHIVQIQRNALLANWLRHGEYRPFPDRIASFQERVNQLSGYVRDRNYRQTLAPTTCAVTYINQIPIGNDQSWTEVAGLVLNCLTNPSADWLPPVDRGHLQLSFPFPHARGRLYVFAKPAQQTNGEQSVFQLELTARLAVPGEEATLEAAIACLQTGHDWIVRGFASLTRPEMHQVWRRIR